MVEPQEKAKQFALDLGSPPPRFEPGAFVIAGSNRDAAATAKAFATSGELLLAICGPAGSGKTHLSHLIAAFDGNVVDAQDLWRLPSHRCSLLVLDNAERCGEAKLLFALIEERRSLSLKTAVAGRGRPSDWAAPLKDLATRLEAMPRATLDEPDEELMRAVIDQRFRDRQWRTAEGIAALAAPRLSRTFAAATAFVEAVGAASVSEGRPITLALARSVLASLSEGISGA